MEVLQSCWNKSKTLPLRTRSHVKHRIFACEDKISLILVAYESMVAQREKVQ